MEICLTKYSHGAGCGCKISPKVLDLILHSDVVGMEDKRLLVGNGTRDDAAVYDLGDGTAIISTTDFFMPIVDDPTDFGRIASVNAISDVYAMGGTPMMAIAVLGWPIDKLAPEVARQVVDGAKLACRDAGIVLAGGHSIDSPEPIFGLAVTGRVSLEHLKRNDTAIPGCLLYLTKPLGVGILSTAQKKGILKAEHAHIGRDSMVKLNKAGETFGKMKYVRALTDVTGFGLLGHLSEICEGSGVSAVVDFSAVPVIPEALEYLALGAVPGGTNRNWDSYGHKIGALDDTVRRILADPQTSGGLLVAVEESAREEFESEAKKIGLDLKPVGKLGATKSGNLIEVVNGRKD